MFVGTVEPVYATGRADFCGQLPVPVALELARFFAIATTLSTAIFAALTLFRSQVDRIAIRRARALTVVVGLDEDTLPLVAAIARRMGANETLAIITSDSNRSCVSEARSLGARIREMPLTDSAALAHLRLWKRLTRLYLLSEDSAHNEERLQAIDHALDALGVDRPRLPLTVRIDNPWHAEVWRRSFLESNTASVSTENGARRWVADAVGKFEITAGRVARHLARVEPGAGAPAKGVLLVGLYPLTYALTSEMAQMHRERKVFDDPDRRLPSRVIVMSPGASGFLTDHQLRQERISPGEAALHVEASDVVPSVEKVGDTIGRDDREFAVVLTDPSLEIFATRLANRRPGLRIYQASTAATSLRPSSAIGSLFPFPVTFQFDNDAPQDAWERAAELIHEAYRANSRAMGWPIAPEVDYDWTTLGPFWKQQNRRQVTHTLALVESVGHTWNTLSHPPAPPLPARFAEMEREDKLRELGFEPETVRRMIAAEHDDWMKSFTSEGWKYAEIRDDKAKRHNRLLPWDQLMAQDEHTRRIIAQCKASGTVPPEGLRLHEHRAQDSLIDTLHTLRSLGYRSIPRATTTELDTRPPDVWRSFRRVGVVLAERRTEPWTWTTEAGDQMVGEAGDWSVVDDAGVERSVDDESFRLSYEPTDEAGKYLRTGVFHARQVQVEETVATEEGPARARVGDWVVKGARGEVWPVPAERFLASYEGLAEGEPT
ncbi:hypothetical protein AU195_13775 [Mycobacterium sp. IS-1496]|nr:hypothetical protein AU195_13775 [Mycobacterium sp. IS-1496]